MNARHPNLSCCRRAKPEYSDAFEAVQVAIRAFIRRWLITN